MTVKRSSRPADDEDEVSFELGKTDDDTCWRVSAYCKDGMTQKEFAEAILLLAEDIISGVICFDDLPDAEVTSGSGRGQH